MVDCVLHPLTLQYCFSFIATIIGPSSWQSRICALPGLQRNVPIKKAKGATNEAHPQTKNLAVMGQYWANFQLVISRLS